MIGADRHGRVRGAEHLLPGVPHLLQRGEPPRRLAVERAGQEARETVADRRVERFDGQHRRPVGVPGLGPAVPPERQLTRCHLVQGHRQRVALGVVVVHRARRGAEEGVKVAGRACLDLLDRDTGQGEVEENELPGAVLPDLDSDVVRLEITVGDALALQVVDGTEQVVAEGLQVIDGEPAFIPQLARDGLLPGMFQDEHGALPDADGLLAGKTDHPGVGEFAQNLRLVIQAGRLLVRQRDLEHLLGAGTFVRGEKGTARRTRAEPLVDPPLPADEVTRPRLQRVRLVLVLVHGRHDRPGRRCGQLVLDQLKEFEELADGRQAVGRDGPGGLLHQPVDEFGDRVDRGRRAQAVLAGQPGEQLRALRGRRLPGEQQVGHRAKAENVHRDRIGIRRRQLGGEITLGGALQMRGDLTGRARPHGHAGGGAPRAGAAGRRLPVADLQPRREPHLIATPAPGRGNGEHAARGQRPVVQVAPVRVPDRLGQLSDHVDPRGGVQPVAESRHVVVEPLGVRPVPKDQSRSGLMLLHRVDLDDARMADAVQRKHLPAGSLLDARPLGLSGLPLHQVDADPAPLGDDLGVLSEVVLPGRTGIERRERQLPRPDLEVAPAPRDADSVQELGEGFRQFRTDPLLVVPWWLFKQPGPDRRQRAGLPTVGGLWAENPVELVVGQLHPQARDGQEHGSLDVRNLQAQPQAPGLGAEQRPQLLGFRVRQM